MALLRRAGALCGGLVLGIGAPLYASHADVPLLSSGPGRVRSNSLGALSFASDKLHAVSIPAPLRGAVLGLYCRLVSVPPSEREHLRSFFTLREFRARKSERAVDAAGALVAPADGRVLAVGTAGAYGRLALCGGAGTPARTLLAAAERDPLSARAVAVGGDTDAAPAALRFALICPRPADALCVSAPADWTVTKQRRVPGPLLAVGGAAESAFTENERVVLEGLWKHGMLAVVAIAGAGRRPGAGSGQAKLAKGQVIEHVDMAAAVVVVFEASDSNFAWAVREGDVVERGQKIATIDEDRKLNLTSEDAIALERLKRRQKPSRAVTGRVRRTW